MARSFLLCPTLLATFVLACLLSTVGCRKVKNVVSPPPKDGGQVTVTLVGDPEQNSGGYAVDVSLYQLANNTVFESAFIETFWQDDEGLLGDELIGSKTTFQLNPNEVRSVTLTLDLETRFLAVAANLRNPDRNLWRAVQPAEALRDKPVAVRVLSDRILMDVSQ